MSCKIVITLLAIFYITLSSDIVKGQELNIKGDTIYVNAEAEIQIKFPTRPSSFNTVPTNAEYTIKGEQTSVIMIAKAENTRPASLLVAEGKRNHHFIIAFKKDIDYGDERQIFYDYGTEKKLQIHIQESASRSVIKDEKPSVATNAGDATGSEKVVKNANDKKYDDIISSANICLAQKKYDRASEAYKHALDLKPGDGYATNQLEIIRKLMLDESSRKEKQKLNDVYLNYITQGENAYNKSQFTEAKIAYQQALSVKQDDLLATSRLKLIDERENAQKQLQEVEINYNTSIQLADAFYKAGDYDGAKLQYAKALGFIKRPYPDGQLKKINKLLADKAINETREEQKAGLQLAKERQEKEQLARENSYDSAVQFANKFFDAGDYDNAKIEYNKALDFVKKDWPKDQINKINKIRDDQVARENNEKREKLRQDLEHSYSAAMDAANKFFDQADYANAKIMYNRAMSLIQRPEPQEKIKQVNKIIADNLAREYAEKQRLAHEAEITAKYDPIIKSADLEFDKRDYIKARKLYTQASSMKPGEQYPKQRLQLIDNIGIAMVAELKAKSDSIARAKELTRKYSVAIAQGKLNYLKNDFSKAKIFYEEATNLEPLEKEPIDQLKIINDRLEDIAKENESTTRYERTLNVADSQLIAKAYDAALNTYGTASKLKPSEPYPKTQIKYIQSELAGIDRKKEVIKKQETEQKYHDDLVAADKAVSDKKYEDAKSLYAEALSIHPDNNYAIERLKIISYQVEKMRLEKQSQATFKDKVPGKPIEKISRKAAEKQGDGHLVFQAKPLPYSNEELKSKYPNINFSSLPPEQPFNKMAVSSKENLDMYDSLVLEKPRLDLSFANGGVKMIVEGIGFEETTAYLKVLIQNNSTEDFLTGAMMLTWTKQTGNHIKLYPNHLYPSPLPVIKPGYEAAVIYVCKTYDVLDGEALTFNLADRFQKIKLQVNIPGTAYNQEWVRY